MTLVFGLSSLLAPFEGGTLVPSLDLLLPLSTDASGGFVLPATWPGGVPSGVTFLQQIWFANPAGPVRFAASNGLQATVP